MVVNDNWSIAALRRKSGAGKGSAAFHGMSAVATGWDPVSASRAFAGTIPWRVGNFSASAKTHPLLYFLPTLYHKGAFLANVDLDLSQTTLPARRVKMRGDEMGDRAMNVKTESLGATFTLAFRYATLFGGIISLMLLLANIERTGNPQALQHHISFQRSP